MIKEKAYAKVNLFLNVVHKRFDGYHDLEMVMASIDLYDIITFKPRKDTQILVTSDHQITTNMEDNIVYKIATYLQEEYRVRKGVDIHIQKQIPIAAGLAGGSADGAATLRGLNQLWKLKLSLEELAEIGLEFGSDIPFCVHNKLCIAKGRGEQLMFFDTKLHFPILIVNPRISVSTKEVFGNVQKESIQEKKISDMASGIYNKNLKLVTRELHNSLEDVVFPMYPEIEALKKQLIQWGAQGALMSGSGSTVFAIDENKNNLKSIMEIIPDKYFTVLTKIR